MEESMELSEYRKGIMGRWGGGKIGPRFRSSGVSEYGISNRGFQIVVNMVGINYI
jgi:hypothetical protein